jgi:hypothetical protein
MASPDVSPVVSWWVTCVLFFHRFRWRSDLELSRAWDLVAVVLREALHIVPCIDFKVPRCPTSFLSVATTTPTSSSASGQIRADRAIRFVLSTQRRVSHFGPCLSSPSPLSQEHAIVQRSARVARSASRTTTLARAPPP